tara:strand:+ start:25 stop:219 length:195 start_codon:yes stop_codon:yes gene_type:complete
LEDLLLFLERRLDLAVRVFFFLEDFAFRVLERLVRVLVLRVLFGETDLLTERILFINKRKDKKI